MGAQHDYSMHNLPAILERWRLSKNADRCGSSQPLATYMKTPMFPSGQSFSDVPRISSERTPERVVVSRFPLNEDSVVTSFDALNIKEEDISCLTGDDSIKEVEGGIKKVPLAPHPLSLGEECAFTQLLMVCRQSGPVQLSEAFSAYCDMSSIIKIGEGTYGEAYKAGETVCKVVPIDGHQKVNGEVQKKSEEVLDEVVLSLTLNNLRAQQGEKDKQNSCPCIIETKDFRVCRGAYGPDLVRAWESWDDKHGSENDHPKDFLEEQCYIVFVLADGGRDLESFVLLDFDEARSLLMQVSVALAVAEVECQFEHRDLHWGNILLNRTEDTRMNFILEGRKFCVNTFGLKISIIDFTLSRINTGEAILFLDLSADPGLFEGPKGDTQAETYRKMKKITKECWEGSFPKTNILWLMYLVDILLTKKSFKRTSKNERDLRSFKKRLNSYESSQDCLTDDFFSDLLVAIDDPES